MKIRKTYSAVIITFIVCASFFSLYLLFFNNQLKSSAPVYEEIYTTGGNFHKSVRKIDYAIYESLYINGTKQSDVLFLDIQPRHLNGNFWEFTEILVKCPNSKSAHYFQSALNSEIKKAGPLIKLLKADKSENEIILHIFIGEFLTHKIIIKIKEKEPPSKYFRPKIAIIIDDLGYESDLAFEFLDFDFPITFSILPYGPFTEIISQKAIINGHEVLLHLPMEPKNYPSIDPGPGALLLSMKEKEICSTLEQALLEVNGISGISNHMGSSFTENREKMGIVLKELKKKGLCFIDSRTTSGTVGFQEAIKMGVPTASRNVFLDNDLDIKAIEMQIQRLLNIARHSGSAIAIGHPHKETFEVLKEYFPKIKNDFELVPVSELIG